MEEIDLIQLVRNIWNKRNFVFKCLGISILIALVVAFSIPKEYVSSAKLAPELTNPSTLGGLGGLAAMAGISTATLDPTSDAISATLYPDLVKSLPFVMELFPVEVHSAIKKESYDLFTYASDHIRQPWWNFFKRMISRFLGLFSSKDKIGTDDLVGDVIKHEMPSKEEYSAYEAISSRINVSVDKKSLVISISVEMQDPQIAYEVTKAVVKNLQKHITTYRTQKIQNDLVYVEKMYGESKLAYYDSQIAYATFEDSNKNITSSRYRTESERLKNEMNLKYNVYSNLSAKFEETKLRVQEETPVCAILEPPYRPIKHASPSKLLILIVFAFLAGTGSVLYVIAKDRFL